MKRTVCVVCLCSMVLTALAASAAEKAGKPAIVKVGEYTISGPYNHGNLSVFLIHGKDKLKGKTFMTLDEALAQKKAVVHETGNVGQLAVENKSTAAHLYIQSGVIIKGGKQDRTIRYDMVIPPNSGKVSVLSFCVESGRWSQRAGEAADRFESAKGNLSSKELKLAAKRAGSQSEVWKGVAAQQAQLSKNLGQSVQSQQSASSLQLSLENKKLQEAVAKYTKALSGAVAGKKDVVGYAFAINGEINSADVYGSKALFDKVWPGLLESSAVEAVANLKKGKTFTPPAAEAVKALFVDAEKGARSEKNLTKGAKVVIKESKKSILFKVGDAAMDDGFYRLEILSK